MESRGSIATNRIIGSLADNHIFGRMSAKDYVCLAPLMIRTELGADCVLSESGDDVEVVCFPAGALLSIVTPMRNGAGVETGRIGFESAYGLSNVLGDRTSMERVTCQIPGACYRLLATRLSQAAQASPTLTHLLNRHLQAKLAQSRQLAACAASHDTAARIGHWLLMSHDQSGLTKLPITHDRLSYLLGVQRVTVTLAIHALQVKGLIENHHRLIEILDRAGLEAAGCECYAAGVTNHARLFHDFPRLR